MARKGNAMKEPWNLSGDMLKLIEDRAKSINEKLPRNINYNIYIEIDESCKTLSLILLGDKKSNNYYNYSDTAIKKLVEDSTFLNWCFTTTPMVLILKSGYIVFSDCEGIEEYHKIEGYEFDLESIYLNGKEITIKQAEEMGWENDLSNFDFEKINPYKKEKERINTCPICGRTMCPGCTHDNKHIDRFCF